MSIDVKGKKILVTGANGFLGRHVVESLVSDCEVPPQNLFLPSSKEMDLTDGENCRRAVVGQNIVIHLAAKVGGIGYNREKPGEIFYDNLMMGLQLMEQARLAGVEKFVIVGTICAYPKITHVPFKEDDLWNGPTDEDTGPYGYAKKMLLVQAQSYRKQYGFNAIYLLPTNLYGPYDHFSLEYSHVIPALIRKIIEAKEQNIPSVTVWGSGRASREFLYVKDAARGITLAMQHHDDPLPVNLGTGVETPIAELTTMIAEIVDYKGNLIWDATKPDGQPRRCLDITRAREKFAFQSKTLLADGLAQTINWYLDSRKMSNT